MSEATCSTCPYGVRGSNGWKPDIFFRAPSGDYVQCRRRPEFYVHLVNDWCGEHPQRQPRVTVAGGLDQEEAAAFIRRDADAIRKADEHSRRYPLVGATPAERERRIARDAFLASLRAIGGIDDFIEMHGHDSDGREATVTVRWSKP